MKEGYTVTAEAVLDALLESPLSVRLYLIAVLVITIFIPWNTLQRWAGKEKKCL